MDPYLELSIGGTQILKTETKSGAGKTPVWDEQVKYEVKDMSQEVHFKVYDEDPGSDDVVGEATCSLADLCKEIGSEQTFEIKYDDKAAGTVKFMTTWFDGNETAKADEDQHLVDKLKAEEEEEKKTPGTLCIKIVSADLTRDTDTFGKMDPFLELLIGGTQIFKTSTKNGAGKTPVWNEEVNYEVKDMDEEVFYRVSEEDTASNDIVGEGTCKVADLCKQIGSEQTFEIKFNETDAGTVKFMTTWVDADKLKAQQEAGAAE